MSDRVAFVFGAILLSLIIADAVFQDWQAMVFLGRKFMGLIEWVAFWR